MRPRQAVDVLGGVLQPRQDVRGTAGEMRASPEFCQDYSNTGFFVVAEALEGNRRWALCPFGHHFYKSKNGSEVNINVTCAFLLPPPSVFPL